MIFGIMPVLGEDPIRSVFINQALASLLPDAGLEVARFPLIKCIEPESATPALMLFLLTPQRPHALPFFYEMVSRWLVPGRHLHIASFFATDFFFADLPEEHYTVAEMALSFASRQELEHIQSSLSSKEAEIKWGLASPHHAQRILEMQGLPTDAKTSLIQERLLSLLERRPQDFDYAIFNQLHHFLVKSSEAFREIHSSKQMSRLICLFYLFQKGLRECPSGERAVFVKVSRTCLNLPCGVKKVLSLFIGLHLLSENELFEQHHLLQALAIYFPHIRPLEESCFASPNKEEKIQMLYLEIERADGADFSSQEIRNLRTLLPEEVKRWTQKLPRPVFMPRNEEEVIRTIVILSKQLRTSRDLPQVTISFDEQRENELLFTIILARVLKKHSSPIQELFEKAKPFLKVIPERVNPMGKLRKRFMREAAVFHVALPALNFLRPDHSIDLFKARQEVLNGLQSFLGEVRDYNGGMIAKQHEQFLALKALFPALERRDELLLEQLFHSIYPGEMRSIIDPAFIKVFFTLLCKMIEEKTAECVTKQEREAAFFLCFSRDGMVQQVLAKAPLDKRPLLSQLVTISLSIQGGMFFGYIYLEDNAALQKNWIHALMGCLPTLQDRVA